MSLFNKPVAERPQTRIDTAASENSMSVIGAGMRVVGDVESTGIVKVEGTVEGGVRGARQILLGKSGVIHGDVHAADVVVGGKVVGTVVATERVEVQGSASIEGDIHTRSIVVFEGGAINGAVRMGEGAASRATQAPTHSTPPTIRLATDS